MKKNLSSIVIIALIISIIVIVFISMSKAQNMTVVYKNNTTKQPIKIIKGKFQDSDCGMVIDELDYSSQVVSPSGSTWFFHDHGGMAHWLYNKPFKDKAVVWVWAKDAMQYIDGKKAWYSRTDETPMHYGFGAYKNKKDGFIDFETMSLHMIRGENLTNPQVKKQLLGK
jgi:hypothetical protein